MRNILLIILGDIILLSLSCVTTKRPCPYQDIVGWGQSAYGWGLIKLHKGFCSEEHHSIKLFKQRKGWITVKEFEALLKEKMQKREDIKWAN